MEQRMGRWSSRVLGLIAVSFIAGSGAAADWPQWRGPGRDGKSNESGLPDQLPQGGPKRLWSKTDLKEVGTGYGSPAIAGGKLFILGGTTAKQNSAEFVTCLDANTGAKVWQKELATTPGGYNDGWGGGPRSTPTLDGERLYVVGSTGDLVCLNATSGELIWTKNFVKDFGGKIPTWGYSESVLIDGDKLLCTPGKKGGVTCLNKATGATIWTCQDLQDDAGYSSILVATLGGVRQYVTQTMASGVGIGEDGKLLWQVKGIGRRVAVIPTPVIKDDFVFFTAGYGAGCELVQIEKDGSQIKAKPVYKSGLISNHHGGVIEYQGKLYGHTDNKSVWFCLDYLKGGEEALWTSNKLEKGSISYADGHFYCLGEREGTLVQIVATPDGWKETGRFKIPELSKLRPNQGKVWAHPVIANGKLYLRDYEKLFCFELR